MKTQQEQPVVGRYVEHRVTRSGEQKAYLVGTRLAVEYVYVCHELRGMTPDQIVAEHPQLSLAQVHAALAYFFDHADEVRGQLKRSEEYALQKERENGPTKFSTLRDAMLGTRDGGDADSPAS